MHLCKFLWLSHPVCGCMNSHSLTATAILYYRGSPSEQIDKPNNMIAIITVHHNESWPNIVLTYLQAHLPKLINIQLASQLVRTSIRLLCNCIYTIWTVCTESPSYVELESLGNHCATTVDSTVLSESRSSTLRLHTQGITLHLTHFASVPCLHMFLKLVLCDGLAWHSATDQFSVSESETQTRPLQWTQCTNAIIRFFGGPLCETHVCVVWIGKLTWLSADLVPYVLETLVG